MDRDRASEAGTASARGDLSRLFNPRSIAIVGASANPAKWGHWLSRSALHGRDHRAVYLVNRNGGESSGIPCTPRRATCPKRRRWS